MRFFTKRKWQVVTLSLLLAFSLAFSLIFVQNQRSRKNDGFSIEKIQSTLGNRSEWQLPGLPSQYKNICNQPYYYLGRGLQFYAFESKDKQYVLKFMRHQRLEPHPFIERLGMLPLCNFWRDRERALCLKRVNYICDSLKVAMLYAPQETGLIFVHLNKDTSGYDKVQIFDKMGASYYVNLDETEFVLQKKAELIKPTLSMLMQSGREHEAKIRINQIFSLLRDCAKIGVCDTDGALIRKNNLGFLEDRAIYIDTGKLMLKESIKTKERFTKDLERLDPLYAWLQLQFPPLAEHFLVEKQRVLDAF